MLDESPAALEAERKAMILDRRLSLKRHHSRDHEQLNGFSLPAFEAKKAAPRRVKCELSITLPFCGKCAEAKSVCDKHASTFHDTMDMNPEMTFSDFMQTACDKIAECIAQRDPGGGEMLALTYERLYFSVQLKCFRRHFWPLTAEIMEVTQDTWQNVLDELRERRIMGIVVTCWLQHNEP